MDASAASSSASALAQRRWVCPDHGLLADATATCGACTKKPYDIDSPDDRSILTSLRGVAVSSRTTRARLVCYPVALLGLALILGLGALTLLLTPIAGEPLSRALERVLRNAQPSAWKVVDAELLR